MQKTRYMMFDGAFVFDKEKENESITEATCTINFNDTMKFFCVTRNIHNLYEFAERVNDEDGITLDYEADFAQIESLDADDSTYLKNLAKFAKEHNFDISTDPSEKPYLTGIDKESVDFKLAESAYLAQWNLSKSEFLQVCQKIQKDIDSSIKGVLYYYRDQLPYMAGQWEVDNCVGVSEYAPAIFESQVDAMDLDLSEPLNNKFEDGILKNYLDFDDDKINEIKNKGVFKVDEALLEKMKNKLPMIYESYEMMQFSQVGFDPLEVAISGEHCRIKGYDDYKEHYAPYLLLTEAKEKLNVKVEFDIDAKKLENIIHDIENFYGNGNELTKLISKEIQTNSTKRKQR